MWPNPRFSANLVTFTEKILNENSASKLVRHKSNTLLVTLTLCKCHSLRTTLFEYSSGGFSSDGKVVL